MIRLLLRAILAAALLGSAAFVPAWSAALGADGLKLRHASIAQQLASSAFGRPLVLQSGEVKRRIEGNAYAVLQQPFATVAAALSDSRQWCDVLILHLNTKFCRRTEDGGVTRIDMRVGKKTEQAVEAASLLRFDWRQAAMREGYFRVDMHAAEGPYDTRDYQLLVEAIPLDDRRTFLHMGYTFGFGAASHMALRVYLATLGSGKVGFSPAEDGKGFIGGMRGVAERNTMRYLLAIEAYLDALAVPLAQQLELRIATWFDATERFAQQLHEVSRDDYLQMKRNECKRLSASR